MFVRRVRTGSGAIAVQIAEREGGRDRVIEHLGSAHTDGELAVLMQVARERIHPGQDELDLQFSSHAGGVGAVVESQTSRLLIETIRRVYERLGFDRIDDEAFFQLVLARLVEPTSKTDSLRVLNELGVSAVHLSTVKRCLRRCIDRDYRGQVAGACFRHAGNVGDVSLVLYDVTTLYFEAEKEDELRKVGYSKERRVDPQIVVGLLVDKNGFPLEITCWEGNKAETATILPTIRAFQDRHGVRDIVVVADAGMLSVTNLRELDDAGLRFIVGSRTVKAPGDLASHLRWNGDAFTDGQVIDTITPRYGGCAFENDPYLKSEPVWDRAGFPGSWRAVWAYSAKRAVRDTRTLALQEERARAVVAGGKHARSPRFVTVRAGSTVVDEASLQRAKSLVGLKGYVTNIEASIMPAAQVIASYHDLWHVEQSFRMSKTDLKARPIFHHTKDAIEAHLTIVMTALAIARYLQNTTGMSLKKIIHTLRPLQDVTIVINGHHLTATPQLTPTAQTILKTLTH